MSNAIEQIEHNAAPGTTGIVLHRPSLYDLFVWVVSLGRESALYRGKTLHLPKLKAGESVLDNTILSRISVYVKHQAGY